MKIRKRRFLQARDRVSSEHMARIESELTIDRGRAVVSLGGALDVTNAYRFGALLRRLVNEGCTDIVVDLGTASFIDAAGIGIFRGAANAMRRTTGGRFGFRNAPGAIEAALRANGVDNADDEAHDVVTPVAGVARPKPAREVQPPTPRQAGRSSRTRISRG